MTIQVYHDHSEVSDEEFNKLKELVNEGTFSRIVLACDFITGVNVENASYGAGVCAERAALTRAVSQGQRKFRVIAIAADTEKPIVPCGICRQFIREFSENIALFLFNQDSEYIKVYLKDLLPLSFGPESLGIEVE
ncbi:hypothetical protein I9W82_003963 [Candida metapsilosis]|uniref:CMP/dCMP-type deaminase domain-containing protein n=1 Tax=Candida metapsilosis TaxID=273372 RepID=A0A8H7ZAS9_9ASCO|nr:hypothetical protein I9W82_003963 [Candida metapsilosis]